MVVNFQLMRTEEIEYYYIKMLRENACNKTFEFVVCLSPIPFGFTNSIFGKFFVSKVYQLLLIHWLFKSNDT